MILKVAMYLVILFTIVSVILLIRSKENFSKILYLGLLSSLVVVAIVLYAITTGQSMYLDVAITIAILGFMDVQFYAVYLSRKGSI
ncbi:MAG: monovalent cation/H+ antiporter complex subunit F [Eubacteriales bacterium]